MQRVIHPFGAKALRTHSARSESGGPAVRMSHVHGIRDPGAAQPRPKIFKDFRSIVAYYPAAPIDLAACALDGQADILSMLTVRRR